jgi:hypothetical protein
MICPVCRSDNVREMGFQNRLTQIMCDSCHHMGRYIDFGLDRDLNTGLISSTEHATYKVAHEFFDASDPEMQLVITVHDVDGKTAGNVWITPYGQTLKFLPERVMEGQADIFMMRGEILRIIQDPKGSNYINGDFRFRMAFLGLESAIRALEKKA